MSQDSILSVRALSKSFPGVLALDAVDFEVAAGEVHALLGENGAGKSTLLKILSGAQKSDGGSVQFAGQALKSETPLEATRSGIVTIYQEFSLIPPLSIAENIFLGRQPKGAFGLDYRKMYEDAAVALGRIGLDLDPRREVSSLSVAEQQLVEIARALSMDSRLIIMDEPTAALSGSEVDRLLEIVDGLRRQGLSIVYVTHRLSEVFRICDRYTVLRDGQMVAKGKVADTDEEGLIRSMVGRELDHLLRQRAPAEHAEVALEVRGLCSLSNMRDPNATRVEDVSFKACFGEVLGIAGLVGAGRTETVRMIFGADKIRAGEISIAGRPVEIGKPLDAINHGLGLVTEDRKTQGCFQDLSVKENISMASLKQLSNPAGVLDLSAEKEMFLTSRERFDIKVAGPGQAIGKLSGGNQQKALIARWLAKAPKILIVDEPTRGIDIRAKAQVHDILFELADQGAAVIVISSELTEVLTVSDRIITMSEGRVTGEFSREEASEEVLMRRMTPSQSQQAALPA